MSIKDYIKELNKIKRLAVDRWGNLTSIEVQVINEAYDWLLDNLDIKRGEIQTTKELTVAMDNFVAAVVEIINTNKNYQGRLNSFLSDLKTMQKNNTKFHSTFNGFNIETAGVTEVQKAVVNEVIEQYTGSGLNAHFAVPLRDLVYRNILAGMNMRQARQVLETYILSGEDKSGKLSQYLDQTAMQAVDTYQGVINQKIIEEFKTTGLIISGSLIETSSKQCVYAVETSEEGYLGNEDWEKVLDMAKSNEKAKLIPGTTIKNLPINKLHWGCRHDFTPVVVKPKK